MGALLLPLVAGHGMLFCFSMWYHLDHRRSLALWVFLAVAKGVKNEEKLIRCKLCVFFVLDARVFCLGFWKAGFKVAK